MPYKYLEDVSIADVAFTAEGATLEKMFESAGLAVTNTMVKNMKSVKSKVKKTIKLKAPTAEKLLFDFLQELVYWKDKSLLLFSKINVRITEPKKAGGAYSLVVALAGEKLDAKRHEMLVDVKAVTMHLFEVKKEGGKWTCRVVLDV